MKLIVAIVALAFGTAPFAAASDRDTAELGYAVPGSGQMSVRIADATAKLGSGLVPTNSAGAVGRDKIELLLNAIVVWISSNFDLPAVFDHPEVRLVSDETLTSIRYGENSDGGRPVVALYQNGFVFLSKSWRSRSPADLSVLVHEMVHHLQNFDRHIYSCIGEREKLAYEVQEKWLHHFGRSLQQDFEIDPLTLKVVGVCVN